MDCNTVIDTIKQHAAELRKRGVTGMYLYGSTSRDEAGPNSDIDVFIDYDKNEAFSLVDLVGVRRYLEEVLAVRADVLDRDSLHPRIKHKIISESIMIFDDATRF